MESRPVMVVYVDVALPLYFLVDLAWFWLTGRLAGVRARFWRLALAALVGAATDIWALFPSGRWIATLPAMVLGSLFLLALAFWPCPWRQALRAALSFLLSGASMAGLAVLVARRAGPDATFPSQMVIPGVLLALAGGRFVWEAAQERSRLRAGLFCLRVTLSDRAVELPALLDTGNGLKEPLSGRPVAVVEARALTELLPATLLEAAVGDEPRWDLLSELPERWAAQIRPVPFRTVGRPAGLLLAFAPDGLAVKRPGDDGWQSVGGFVALSGCALDADGAYRALLPPRMLL